MERKSFLFFVIAAFCVLASSQCKKSPITPDTETLVRPIIWLNSTEVSFTAFESGPNPAGQMIKIKNSGQNSLKYEILEDADWVSVEPPSGTSSGQMNEHTIVIDKSGLTAQDADHTATVTIVCPEAYNNPQKVTVRLTVTKEPPPEISASPQALTFAAQSGGANPPLQNIAIRNSGQNTLEYAISDDAAWLEISPANGTSGGESKTHVVSVACGGLTEGNYSATITVSDPKAANNPQTVPVSLKVSKDLPPVIWVDKPGMSFTAVEGGSSPAPQMIDIKNSGGGTLNYAITWDSAWMTVVPQSGSSGGQTNSHSVSVNSGGLGVGTYNGTITITGQGAANSPQQVSVTLQVTGIPTNNEIRVGCNPNQGSTGTTVNCPISIVGNLNEIAAFGLQLVFDTNMFEYVGTSKGSLTGDWSYIDGNSISGTVTIGGLSGSGNPIPTGSSGTLVVVVLKVTGGSYPNGQQSTVIIQAYTDDVAGMKPEPAAATFTYKK
jgi:hypothetical protein